MIHKAILTFVIIALIGVAFLDGAVECSTQVEQLLPQCEQLQVSPGVQALLF